MKRKKVLLPAAGISMAVALLAHISCANLGSTQSPPSVQPTVSPMAKQTNGVHVLELFTSEGCSSCPPADGLLARIKAEGDSAVFVLSYHVDYWDYTGWKDPFSQAAFSDRQRQYAQRFGLEGSYTPQVVVNGGEEFVGSDEKRLRASLAKPGEAPVTITASAALSGQKALQLSYSLSSAEGLWLNVAVVQAEAKTDVTRGENGGRRLQHVNIVRELSTTDARPGGTVAIQLPDGVETKGLSLIVFVQKKSSGKITGAVRTAIPVQKDA